MKEKKNRGFLGFGEMESGSGICKEDDQMELPPGFRFHPTDEELISHYLSPKVLNNRFAAIAIGEVDLNKCEPWDLPCKLVLCFSSSVLFAVYNDIYFFYWFLNREGKNGRERMVFLLPERSKIPDGA